MESVAKYSKKIILPPSGNLKTLGTGIACCHHGEILQGLFEEQNGKKTYGLVTLFHPEVTSKASFCSNEQHSDLKIFPSYKTKSLEAAKLTLKILGKENYKGAITLQSLAEDERGLGSSTADIVASCRSIANALGQQLTPEQIAYIAVKAELASDPIMHESSTVLFAQREGRVIETLGGLLPPMYILSFTLGSPVNTCNFQPPNYSWEELQQFKVLRGLLRYGLSKNDLKKIAEVGTSSAIINQNYLPKSGFDNVISLVGSHGILGLQVAHSGNLVGLIFSPFDEHLTEKVFEVKHYISEIGGKNISSFNSMGKH